MKENDPNTLPLFPCLQEARLAPNPSQLDDDVHHGKKRTLPYSIPIYRVTLVKEGNLKLKDRPIVSSSHTAATILRDYLQGADREHFVVILLNSKNRMIGVNTVSIGTLTSSLAHPREVLKPAIEHNAAQIIVGHNHPSGDVTPSHEDREITSRLKQGAEIMGIPLLDHIVLGEDRWISFKDEGWL